MEIKSKYVRVRRYNNPENPASRPFIDVAQIRGEYNHSSYDGFFNEELICVVNADGKVYNREELWQYADNYDDDVSAYVIPDCAIYRYMDGIYGNAFATIMSRYAEHGEDYKCLNHVDANGIWKVQFSRETVSAAMNGDEPRGLIDVFLAI